MTLRKGVDSTNAPLTPHTFNLSRSWINKTISSYISIDENYASLTEIEAGLMHKTFSTWS